MNIKHGLIGFIAIAALQGSVALAAPAVEVSSGSGQFGSGTPVQITVEWDGVAAVVGAQFDITYDNTQLTPNITNACTSVNWGCSVFSPGTLRFVSSIVVSGIPDEVIGTIAFDISSAAINVYPLTVTNQQFGDIGEQPVPPSGTVNGQVEVTSGPQPSFSSVPAPGVINLGPVNQGAAAPTQNISISNNGQATSTLTGTCAMGAGDTEITLTSDGAFSVLQGAAADVQTVSCSTAVADTYSRTLTCPHNGTNGPNAVYTVNCTVNPPPAPEYSSNPAIGVELDFGGVATEQGDTDPTDSISITNSGDTGTNLNVTCTDSNDPSGVFSVSNGVISNLLPTGGARVVTVTCDSAIQGNYTGTLSCDHNGETATDPATYPLNCAIGPPGAAVFGSNPIPGSTIDLTPTAVPEGENVPSLPLQFSNLADPGDSDLEIQCSLSGSAPPISSVGTDFSSPVNIPAGSSASAAFDCDTTTAGVYTATYSCGYNTSPPVMMGSADGGQSVPFQFNASYTVECEVREPEAQVEITPAPDTPQTKSVPPGGSTSFEFDFEEVNDEGVDGNLISCNLGTGGQGFTISSPTFPVDVGSGDTVTVVVDFADPTGADSWSDTLTCMFSDGDDDDTAVIWPLTVNIGGDARFTVLKQFTDGNPGDVTVSIDCNTGLILDQDKVISEDGIGVTFVVTSYDAGEMDCNVTEAPVAGYSADYEASGDSNSSDADDPSEDAGCFWTEIAGGVENLCVITNSPDPVDVVVHKEWLYPGSSSASDISNEFEVMLVCENAEIVDGDKLCGYVGTYGAEQSQAEISNTSCKWLQGYGDETFTEQVIPYDWPGGTCYAVEVNVDQAVEVDNGCGLLEVSAGSGDSCTIINTVFFEGIPTLSQYGMALMALLMLGIGFVAVRRIA